MHETRIDPLIRHILNCCPYLIATLFLDKFFLHSTTPICRILTVLRTKDFNLILNRNQNENDHLKKMCATATKTLQITLKSKSYHWLNHYMELLSENRVFSTYSKQYNILQYITTNIYNTFKIVKLWHEK